MITKIIDEELIQAAKREILDAEKIVIVSHTQPDGDAVGSSLALCLFLQSIDKEAVVILPNDMPDFLKWMPGADAVMLYDKQREDADKVIKDADLVMALDFNALHRIDDMGIMVADCKARKVMVDHHEDPGNFADVVISYPKMSSTSEMVFRLICRMGYAGEIDEPIATCIYTGMMTDTGSFTYNSQSAEIYIIISELIKKGIDKDRIYRNVFYNNSEGRYRLQGYLLSKRMEIDYGLGMSIITLTKEDGNLYNLNRGDTEGFVNIPLSIRGVILSVFFKEEGDKTKISFRSIPPLAVNDMAANIYGGGGHVNAAGASTKTSLKEAVKLFKASLPLYKERIAEALRANGIEIATNKK